MKSHRSFFAIAVVCGCSSTALFAADVDYTRDVKSVFKARCFACHGALKQEAGLRLDTGTLIRHGGESGPAVMAGDVEASLLVDRISAEDEAERMPPEGEPLSKAQIEAIKAWISSGADAPQDEQPEEDLREHWSFKPPIRPAIPITENSSRILNPIDAFVSARRQKRGLDPAPPAEKHHQLRRVYLDLIGLPPTQDELSSFLADNSPDAYDRVVDRLLDSSHYGERWARHWMDVWRYSDWYGRRMVPDVWNSAPQIWRWRDWIIHSLNDDKGYDRMVKEMLAADEIAPEDYESAVATGYLIRNWYALNPNDWMRSNVEHTGKAFLGLTFNCAHCHDHKYDPILQTDYFRLRAFFEPIAIRQDRVPGEADPGLFQEYEYSTLRKIQRLGAVRIYDRNPHAPTWFYTGGDERNRVEDRGSIPPGVPDFLGSLEEPIETVELPTRAWYPGLQSAIQETVLEECRVGIRTAQVELDTARSKTATSLPALREQLADAEAEFKSAAESAADSGASGALSGRQSLVLDATSGRRIVQHNLQELEALNEGTTIRFDLKIVRDAHFNCQLAKDTVQGWTAGFLAFIQGRIVAYQPGTTTEFEVGRYDFSSGQDRFDVQLVLRPQSDSSLLTIRSRTDDRVLVENVTVALNGWNPVGDPTKGLTFDARTGSVAVIDDVTLSAPQSDAAGKTVATTELIRFDFELPTYSEGSDVVGVDGWSASKFCQAPATSVVSMVSDAPELTEPAAKLRAARRALESCELQVKSAAAHVEASETSLRSVQARIAADRVKFGDAEHANPELLSRETAQLERKAALQTAEAAVLKNKQLLAAAEAKPVSDMTRAKEIETAAKQLADSTAALAKVRAAKDEAQPGAYSSFSPTYPTTSTGRRSALAAWIVSRQNPLAGRVAINHIWTRHFHAPLVATVFDFGRNGARPTHPQLLDWLAVELMDSGWSMKHIHHLIVTSQTYRMSSSLPERAQRTGRDVDPQNQLLWRMNVGRMEAEIVRDSLLFCAGKLERQLGGQELENSEALTTHRRSLYYSCHPESNGKSDFGRLFDAPDAAECYRRTQSVVPQQALALTNSDLVHDLSQSLASQLEQELEPDATPDARRDAFIVSAYERILSRSPMPAELALCREFLTAPSAASTNEGDAELRARAGLVRALFSHNDFITIR